ncbi:MAG: Ribbon-helix-helix protein, copG family [Syntrophus sp. PtaU1.Bin005]|nr:MAG: Ribbon-helix-helix protein, copG family [Syntrophus sp. PtaU1.Bin005]
MNDETKGKKITFHCPDDIAERLDRLAEKGDIPRSKLVLNMVETMTGFLESTQKVGILHLAILLRDAGEKLKDVSKKWKDKNTISDLTEDKKTK